MAQLPLGASGRKHPDAPPEYIDTSKIFVHRRGGVRGLSGDRRQEDAPSDGADHGAALGPGGDYRRPAAGLRDLAEAPTEVLTENLIDTDLCRSSRGGCRSLCRSLPLTKAQMRLTLTEPKNSVIKQQIELFRRDGIELVFTEEALDAVVEKATAMKTGVRALRALVKGMTTGRVTTCRATRRRSGWRSGPRSWTPRRSMSPRGGRLSRPPCDNFTAWDNRGGRSFRS